MKLAQPRFFGDLHVVPCAGGAVQVRRQFGLCGCRFRLASSALDRFGIARLELLELLEPAIDLRPLRVRSRRSSVDPLRQRLIVHDHVDDREHGRQVAAPQHGDHERREHARHHVARGGSGRCQRRERRDSCVIRGKLLASAASQRVASCSRRTRGPRVARMDAGVLAYRHDGIVLRDDVRQHKLFVVTDEATGWRVPGGVRLHGRFVGFCRLCRRYQTYRLHRGGHPVLFSMRLR